MTALNHKTPCEQCPFKIDSIPGYLGATTAEQFIESTYGEIHMPCHTYIDYDDPDWEAEQLPFASHCAGSLIHLKNSCKQPIDIILREMIDQVSIDRENVISFKHNFLNHHGEA